MLRTNVNTEASHDWRVILDKVHPLTLDNGLQAIVLPVSATGSVVCDIYYAGGSAADPPRRAGLTHFLEHMLFNGTRAVPKGALDRIMLRLAGQHNAETGPDFCRFWSQLPKAALELALALEADRMRGAILDEDDFLREKQVILEEEARYKEQPFEDLMARLTAELFAGHPYAHPTIGVPEDLDLITAEDLRNHYRQMFRPSNAVLVVAGDTTKDSAFKRIDKHFGAIPPAFDDSRWRLASAPPENRFDGRSLEAASSELVPRGAMLWPAPGPFDLDGRPWGIAASILGGGRSSRLWKKLVEETQIAAHISVGLSEERLGGYLSIDLELHPGQEPRIAETLVHEVLSELAQQGPTQAELERVAAFRSASACWARQQTHVLAAAVGTWRLFADLESLGEAWRRDDLVTCDDVARVAGAMRRDNLARGWTLPSSAKPSGSPFRQPAPRPTSANFVIGSNPQAPVSPPIERLVRNAKAASHKSARGHRSRLSVVKSGPLILAEPAPNQGIAALELRWRHGALEETIPGLANLAARVCEECADSQTGMSFVEAFENLGASIDSGASGVSVQGRGADFDTLLDLLLRMIARPVATAGSMRRSVLKTRTDLEADMDDPAFQAELLLREMAFEGLPGSTDVRGTPASLGRIRIAHVREHYANWFRPSNMILGIAGDFRGDRALHMAETRIRKSFGMQAFDADSAPGAISTAVFDRPLPATNMRAMRSPGTQTHVVMGHRTVARTHPDWVALQVLEIILGSGPGLTDLLSRRLREELGIVYGVNMTIAEGAWTTPGLMRVSFSCDPADAAQAESETLRIISDAASGRLSEADCCDARDHLANSWYMSYESADDRLSSRLDAELEDWDLSVPPRWARACAALSADDIRAAASRHIKPGSLQIVRYGP